MLHMSWINGIDARTPIEGLLGHRPELLSRYKAFYSALWEDGLLPRRVLELCRLRIAAIHGCTQESIVRDSQVTLSPSEVAALNAGDLQGFTPAERSALAIAGRFPFEHHAVDDAAVGKAKAEFGSRATVALMVAFAFFDVTCRWKLAFDLDTQAALVANPPLSDGSLA